MNIEKLKGDLQIILDDYKNTRTPMTYLVIKLNSEKHKELKNQLLQYSIESELNLKTDRYDEIIYQLFTGQKVTTCYCGKECNYISFTKGYNPFCCKKCQSNSDESKLKMSLLSKGRPSKLKGKSYKEIYGDTLPGCGFKSGDFHISKVDSGYIEKLSMGVKKSYTVELREVRRKQMLSRIEEKGINSYSKVHKNSIGETFRSSLEVLFSELLIKHKIPYEYEKKIKLNNGHFKIVDFVLFDDIYIEITGYAYLKWKKDFYNKIVLLRQVLDSSKSLVLLTYNEKYHELQNDFRNIEGVFIDTLTDRNINLINYLKSMTLLKGFYKKLDGRIEEKEITDCQYLVEKRNTETKRLIISKKEKQEVPFQLFKKLKHFFLLEPFFDLHIFTKNKHKLELIFEEENENIKDYEFEFINDKEKDVVIFN